MTGERHLVQEVPAIMMTRKVVLAAMVGLAMLGMPVRALAGGHHRGDWDDNAWPQAWHDLGWQNGWFKNHGDQDEYRPGWTGRNYYQPPAWHQETDADDYRYYQPARHHEPDEDDYWCDGDGDDCQPVSPNYRDYSCDEDGDDCRPVSPSYYGWGYSY
jgi:hypothetical protein